MRLTTKVRYGVRAMEELAAMYNKGPVSVSSISKKESISISYLEQLLNKLKRGGLVESIRGARGGYVLARPPRDINVYDIIKVLEGDIALIFCVSEKKTIKKCDKKANCVTRHLWSGLNENIKNSLKNVSLSDLCRGPGMKDDEKILKHRFHYSI